MRAITVVPGTGGSASLDELPEPVPGDGELLVEGVALGVCGTDREIVAGDYGWAPPGRDRLVLGHESLGRVLEAPEGTGFAAGDLVVGIVRRPDPEPCRCCAAGAWDMCLNGRYRERGIKELDGYGAERYALEADFTVKLDESLERTGVLLEPTSVVAKAWEQIERIAGRACAPGRTALITGAGPIGLLAALLATQRGLDVHVLDLAEDGPKPRLAGELGATYHAGSVADECPEADLVVEATGVGQVVFDVMSHTARGAIVCLTGVAATGRTISVDPGALNNELVLENDVVFGSVNAARRHYEQAAEALARADRAWLERLVSRRVGLDDWEEALERREDDVKVVIDLASARSGAA
ncbi:MAG TPA: glucose 1-dehydrogenase [Thermoleophilaceae bacterium]|jgi:threonine dehydrogenase-like Zn-dependent dehydrogenase